MTDGHRTAAELRHQLHDASGQLSLAMLELGLLLEDPALDAAHRGTVAEALRACRAAGDALRAAWRAVDPGPADASAAAASPPAPGPGTADAD